VGVPSCTPASWQPFGPPSFSPPLLQIAKQHFRPILYIHTVHIQFIHYFHCWACMRRQAPACPPLPARPFDPVSLADAAHLPANFKLHDTIHALPFPLNFLTEESPASSSSRFLAARCAGSGASALQPTTPPRPFWDEDSKRTLCVLCCPATCCCVTSCCWYRCYCLAVYICQILLPALGPSLVQSGPASPALLLSSCAAPRASTFVSAAEDFRFGSKLPVPLALHFLITRETVLLLVR
jgi:hypothetical protein